MEKHLRVPQVAKLMSMSAQTVRRIFEDRPGVKIYGDPAGSRSKRRYRTLLIPESLVRQVLSELDMNY